MHYSRTRNSNFFLCIIVRSRYQGFLYVLKSGIHLTSLIIFLCALHDVKNQNITALQSLN